MQVISKCKEKTVTTSRCKIDSIKFVRGMAMISTRESGRNGTLIVSIPQAVGWTLCNSRHKHVFESVQSEAHSSNGP